MPNNISEISATINTLLESNDAAQAEHNNIINDKTSIYNRHQYIAQQIAKKHKYVAQQIAKLNENIAKKEDDIAKQKKCLDEKEKTVLKKIAAIEKETDEILKHESSNNGEPSVFNFDNPTGAIAKDANTTVPQMLDIQNIQKTLKIKKIPIISEKDSNSQNYVVITGYNGFEVAIGTVNEIVANYREHVLSRSKGLQPQKITVGNSNDLWGDILRYKSKIELPADNQIIQIIDLYCKEVLELLGPRSSVVYAPNKVATETLIKEDDVIEKKYLI